MTKTIRLTMAQALTRFLSRQMTEIDGETVPIFGGVWAIFGHGNVAGIGEALYAERQRFPTWRGHNEQTMAHAAIAYAQASKRRSSTSSPNWSASSASCPRRVEIARCWSYTASPSRKSPRSSAHRVNTRRIMTVRDAS